MNNWEKIQNAYQAASAETKMLFDSNLVSQCIDELESNFELELEVRSNIIAIYGGIILGIASESDLSNYLMTVAEVEDVQVIMNALTSCYKVNSELLLQTTASAGGTTQTSGFKNMSSEIAEAEAALEKLNPIRTMSSDSKQVGYSSTEEPVYTSTQSALINESK